MERARFGQYFAQLPVLSGNPPTRLLLLRRKVMMAPIDFPDVLKNKETHIRISSYIFWSLSGHSFSLNQNPRTCLFQEVLYDFLG